MATRGYKLDKISTIEILEELKKIDDDNTELFYLYVSTSGKEDEEQTDDHSKAPSASKKDQEKAKKDRKKAMDKVHEVILPKVLGPDGWRKVYDKDLELTYKALYFNIIKKDKGEDKKKYIQRVNAIRGRIAEEADKVKKEYDVNFKINSLLSKPFLYDELALEQSMRELSV